MRLIYLCIVGFIGSLEIATSKGDCGSPPTIDNAESNATSQEPYPTGTVLKYDCTPAYTPSGYRFAVCGVDGTWKQHEFYPMKCTIKVCSDPGSPLHGRRDTYMRSVGTIVRYHCDEGYELNGSSYTECLADKKWTKPTPTCRVVKCPALPSPNNGALDSTAREYRDRVSLECNVGFRSGPTVSRVCQANKTWSGDEFVCQEIDCGSHPPVPNAVVEPQGGTKWGESVHIRCFENAISSSGLPYSVLHCGNEGEWIPDPPTCSSCCDTQEALRHDSVKDIWDSYCIPHGSQLESTAVECNDGYHIDDIDKMFHCENGTFHPPLTCSRIECRIPHVQNGRVQEGNVGHIVQFGSEITVICDRGYEASGPNPIRCDSSNVLYPTCRVKAKNAKRDKRILRCYEKKLKIMNAEVNRPGTEPVKTYEEERRMIALMDCFMYVRRKQRHRKSQTRKPETKVGERRDAVRRSDLKIGERTDAARKPDLAFREKVDAVGRLDP